MQHRSHFQPSPYIQRDTSVSTKQQIQPYLSNPFLLTHSQQVNTENRRVQSINSWTNKQKLQYSIFICYFRDFFNNLSLQSLQWNVFIAMARFIVSKNPQQCRSYHFKVVRVFKGVRMFLRLSIKRVSKMREMLVDAQGELQTIQEEFDMYVDKIHQVKSIDVDGHNIVLDTDNNNSNNNNNSRQTNKDQNIYIFEYQKNKIQKAQNMKTADNYYCEQQQQNPIANNNNNNNNYMTQTITAQVSNNNNNIIKKTQHHQRQQQQNNLLSTSSYFTMLKKQQQLKLIKSKQSLPSFVANDDHHYCYKDKQIINNRKIQAKISEIKQQQLVQNINQNNKEQYKNKSIKKDKISI